MHDVVMMQRSVKITVALERAVAFLGSGLDTHKVMKSISDEIDALCDTEFTDWYAGQFRTQGYNVLMTSIRCLHNIVKNMYDNEYWDHDVFDEVKGG